MSQEPTTVRNTRTTAAEHEGKELTEKAPPTYNDALQLEHVKPPPEYELPKNIESTLPYPRTLDFNPAYPPQTFDFDHGCEQHLGTGDFGCPAPDPPTNDFM